MEQQRAAETAGHEYMEDEDDFDNVSKINERNFEMATSEARRSGRSCRRGTITVGSAGCRGDGKNLSPRHHTKLFRERLLRAGYVRRRERKKER